jgi:hypothetical protein
VSDLPGRIPHHFDGLDVVVYVDEAVSLEVAEHETRYAIRHGCTCTEIVYAADILIEEDRRYRLLTIFHQDDCRYRQRLERIDGDGGKA